MSTANASFTASDDALSLREKIGAGLMWLAVPGAAGAAGTALLTVLDAGGATKVVETWRLYGLVVFVGGRRGAPAPSRGSVMTSVPPG